MRGLLDARRLADGLVTAMRPHCDRIEIAGSIRRGKPEVKDIELVAIPRWVDEPDPSNLFAEDRIRVNQLHRWATSRAVLAHGLQWIKPATSVILPWTPRPDGQYWRGYLPEHELKVDLFLSERETWGLDLLIRTGPAEFGRELMIAFQRRGYRVKGGHLWQGQTRIPTPEEEQLFQHLGLPWIPPADRR